MFLTIVPFNIINTEVMKNIKSIALIAFLTLSMTAMAQPGFPDGTDVEDATAPIPGIALAIAAAIGIGFVKLKRKK